MKLLCRFTLSLILTLAALAGTAAAQTTIPNTTYAPGTPTVVSGTSTITTGTSTVTVSPGATVIYQATGSITLMPGFHAVKGGQFYGMVAASLDANGDGIPDLWETAYGINPGNLNMLDAAGDGLTNLQAYLAGGSPNAMTTLKNGTLPSGFPLVVVTPGNLIYGVNPSTGQISPLSAP